jgi:hypothetical protein
MLRVCSLSIGYVVCVMARSLGHTVTEVALADMPFLPVVF